MVPALRRQLPDLDIVHGDLLDQGSLITAVDAVQPDEVYNLGALSFVPSSWQQPMLTSETTGLGPLRMLEAIRVVSGSNGSTSSQPGIRFYQASTFEMFGQVSSSPQDEMTPFHPRSPYATAKAHGHYTTQNYRESYGMFAVSGIMFNHESPRRSEEFMTRKVSVAVARIALGLDQELRLGNLCAQRDWGYAGDYVTAMRTMLQADRAEDYVIGTGAIHSVRDLVRIAFDCVCLDWEKYVIVDNDLLRPDAGVLCGDARKARQRLGWSPLTSFEQLVSSMVEADLHRLSAAPAHDRRSRR
jgi:GDPmannose 4,6-dehydratase